MKYYTKIQFASLTNDKKLITALTNGTYIAEDGWTVISVQLGKDWFNNELYIITLQKPVNSDEVLRTWQSLDE